MLRLSFCICVGTLLATSAPANADNAASGLQRAAPHLIQEWSAAKKQKRKQTVTVSPDYPNYPSYWSGWRPADPSFDRDGRPYRNPFPGQCMVDLGYGRFESCDQVSGR